MWAVGGANASVTDRLEKVAMNAVSSRAKRSAVEGPRGKTYGNASGLKAWPRGLRPLRCSLDFARNDGEKVP